MPIYTHSLIDPIPSWAEHDEPDEIITHAIQIARDTYILHIVQRDGTCALASQRFNREENTIEWLNPDAMSPQTRSMLNILLDLCSRLIHGDTRLDIELRVARANFGFM